MTKREYDNLGYAVAYPQVYVYKSFVSEIFVVLTGDHPRDPDGRPNDRVGSFDNEDKAWEVAKAARIQMLEKELKELKP